MICKICGTDLPEDSVFCSACGAKQGDKTTTPEAVETTVTTNETPVEETPVVEAPVVETPVEETPVEEAPVEEAPVEEVPAEEAQPQSAVDAIQPQAGKPAKKLLPLVLCITTLVLAVAAIIFLILFNTKTAKVTRAFTKTFKSINSEVTLIQKQLPFSSVIKFLENSVFNNTTTIDITEISGNSTLGTISLGANTTTDVKNEKIIGSANLSVLGNDFKLGYQINDNVYGFNSPKLFSGTLGVNGSTFADDIKSSHLFDETTFGYSDNFNFFEKYQSTQQEIFTKEQLKQIADLQKDYIKTLTIKKSQDTKSTTVNGIDTTCTEYEIVLSETETRKFVKDVAAILSENETFFNEFIKNTSGMVETKQDFVSMADEIMAEVEDIRINIFVANGNVVKAAFAFSVVDDTDFEGTIELGDGKYLINHITSTINRKDEFNDTTIVFETKGDHVGNKSQFTDETVISLIDADYDEPTIITAETTYLFKNQKDNFQFNANMSDAYVSMGFNATGEIKVEKVKKQVSFSFEDAALTIDDNDILVFDFTSTTKKGKLSDHDDFVENDDITNVITMSEDDFTNLSIELFNNIQANYPLLIELFRQNLY